MTRTTPPENISYPEKTVRFITRFAGLVMTTALFYMVSVPQEMKAVQAVRLPRGLHAILPNAEPVPDTIVTGKLTVTGGGIPLPSKPPFPPVKVTTGKLTVTGGGIPLPPQPPFPGVTISTDTLKVTGRTR